MSQGLQLLKNLSYRRYDAHLIATDDVIFDAWPGAIIRNNLLYAAEQIQIQKSACSLREQIDTFPLAVDHPLYNELKEGFPKGYVLTNFSYPNTLNPDKHSLKGINVSNPCIVFKKGDSFSFSLLLIGHFNDYRFNFFEAIRQMCERGIGKPLTSFILTNIAENQSSPTTLSDFTYATENPSSPATLSDFTQPVADDLPSEITIRFLTPVILYRLRDKKNTQLSYQDKTNRFPSFYQLVRSSFSRLQKLYALYENPSEKDPSYYDESCMDTFLENAGRPLLKSANIQYTTYPNTQKKGMKNELPLAGYIGEQTYAGYLQQYLPLLKFMEELGVGNETVYGMGRFEVENHSFTNRIDINVENEIKTLDSFLMEETPDNNTPEMTKLSQLIIRFKNQISHSEIPQLIEAISRKSNQHDAGITSGHNDDGGKVTIGETSYCYPLIQCKKLNGQAVIICIGEGTEAIGNFFASATGQLNVGDKGLEIENVKAEKTIVQAWDNDFLFSIRKYLPFSYELYTEYQMINETSSRYRFIVKILKANILFFLKSIGIHADREIVCEVTELEEKTKVKYKNHTFISFDLRFRTNISLPNYIGLGIGVSHGFGTVARVRSQKNS